MENSHKLIKLLLILVAVLILAFVVFKFFISKPDSIIVQEPVKAIVNKANIDFSKLPDRFPTDIPIESGAKITQNYNARTPEGKFQATRTFVTEKSLTENIEFYTDFLNKDGWKTNLSVDQVNFKMISGSKEREKINISADENKISKIKTITISYTEGGK